MAQKGKKIQTNFNGGILSPYVGGRPDVAQFYNGVLLGRNVALLPEGGFENMPGSLFLGHTKNDGYAIRIPFQPTDDNAFELEFGEGYVRFWKNGALIVEPTGPELITDGTFDAALGAWTDQSSGAGSISWDISQAMLLDAPSVGAVGRGRRSFTTVVGVTYRLTFNVTSAINRKPGLELGSTAGGAEIFDSGFHVYAIGPHTVEFVAISTTTFLDFKENQIGLSSGSALIDDVSVKQISGTAPYEVVSPYGIANLNELKGYQGVRESVDVLFLVCDGIEPRELVYAGDANWSFRTSPFNPKPSFEADTDLNAEAGTSITLTPAATTGTGINFTASSAIFLNGDVDRIIKFGLSRALITGFTSTTIVVCDILTDFPDTNPIPAGQWVLQGSPGGATLNVPRKKPVGRIMNATASVATFRAQDKDKFIKTYGGVLQITQFNSSTQVKVKILTELRDSDKNDPDPAPEGSWTLEVAAWSDVYGWPKRNEFYQGRYALASNNNQKTTHWLSQTNDFYSFAIGALATDSLEYPHRSGTFGEIKSVMDNGALFYNDAFGEHSLKGSGLEVPIGGDEVPFHKLESQEGSAAARPIRVGNTLLMIDWSGQRVMALSYNFERDAQIPKDTLFLARHLTADFALDTHGPAYVQRPIPLIHWRRSDGVVLVQSFNDDPEGGNNGWTTLEMDGEIESYCAVRRGGVPVISFHVKRTIDGNTVRYVEEIRRDVHSRAESEWSEAQTESAIIIEKVDMASQSIFTGLGHLEGKAVDVLMYATGQAVPQVPVALYNGKNRHVVSGGQITLTDPIDFPCKLEVGLPFTPFVKTMRADIPNQPMQGHMRKWDKCMLRLQRSSLPVVNGTDMQERLPIDAMGQGPYLRSGDYFVDTSELPDAPTKKWAESLDGYVEITRNKPYPVRVLMLAGELMVSESMAEATNNEGEVHVPAAA